MKTQIANIKRARKSEAEQAIKDLIDRGYELTYPLTEKRTEGKTYAARECKRVKFVDNVQSGCWMAQLKRVVE